MRHGGKIAVDLFCGCGGISAGLSLAGYDVVAGLDIDAGVMATFKHNFPNATAFTACITSLSPADFACKMRLSVGELDLLAGGPPCQGFSKNVPRKHRFLEDPKNLLVKSFLDYAEHLQPKTVLLENVAEMKNGFEGQYTQEIVNRLERAGYRVSYAVLNAADYGVPQRRRRAFFLANREGVNFRVPQPTHAGRRDTAALLAPPQHVSVWEAIGDLPSLEHGEGQELTPYATDAWSAYQRWARNGAGFVRNHISRPLKPVQFSRLAALQPGQGHRDLPQHLQVKSGYSGAYGRLTKDMVAPTITRWVFHPGSGRYGHPVDTRVLSIREVARIQGFPDSYEFVGTYTQQAGQLGNAVPPLLAATIAHDLDRQIASYNASRSSVRRSSEIQSDSSGNLKVMA